VSHQFQIFQLPDVCGGDGGDNDDDDDKADTGDQTCKMATFQSSQRSKQANVVKKGIDLEKETLAIPLRRLAESVDMTVAEEPKQVFADCKARAIEQLNNNNGDEDF
jgi:hypothetical protein